MDRQRAARHEFACSALAPDAFRVTGFTGDEAISQPFRFEIHLLSKDPDIEFADVIDKKATLTMFRGDDPSEVNGIVVDFQQAQKADIDSDYHFAYRVILMPRLWRLSLSFQSRIFQNLSVDEIVGQILDEADVDHEFELSGSYEPREYTTQYKETDLQFIQRLLEYEGIRYHVQHKDGTDTLILSDDASSAPPIADPKNIAYRYQGGLISADGSEIITDFIAQQQLVTAKTEVKDYNYRTPEQELMGESEINGEQALGKHSDSMIHAADNSRASALAKVRNEEIETTRLRMTGSSDCLRFRVGHQFALEEHYRDSLNQTYLITHVRHEGFETTTMTSDEEDPPPEYINSFTCVPASVPYRPPRLTPEPKLPGVLTAKVESSGGTYAPVDDQGRYRIRFPFDIADAGAAQATKPVRLAQPYTGPGYGQHFPVHKDAEMVVACVDGNVDRILGLSTVYNPTQNSPVTNENAAQNVLRSWGQNELTFDDTQGSELVYLFGTKDHLVEITDNQENHVGTNRKQTVGTDETLEVGQDQKETIGRDNELKVGRDQSLDVGANRRIAVGTSHNESIGSSMSVTVGVASSENVGAAKTVNVGAAYAVTVGAGYQVSVGGVSSESVGGAKSLTSGGSVSTRASTEFEVAAGTDIKLEAGKEGSLKTGKKLFIESGDDFSIKGSKKLNIEAKDQITIKCGSAQIIMKKNGDISIKGKKIDIKGSGKITAKGSQALIN
ncbi:MAG: type VI secretion system tip protein TssI/VgrG [Bacteroidota bacterium]